MGAGAYGYAGADGRPFAAASVKHGIVVGEVSLVTLPGNRHSEDGRPHPTSDSKVGSASPVKTSWEREDLHCTSYRNLSLYHCCCPCVPSTRLFGCPANHVHNEHSTTLQEAGFTLSFVRG